MDNTAPEDSATADRSIEVSRLIDAPAALVFNAWIEPKQLEQWWGPVGFETTVHEMDVEPEGITRLVMRGPDGVEYPNKFVYTDIKAAKLLSYMQSDDSDPDNDAAAIGVMVRFHEEDERTRVTLRSVFKTVAERERVAHEHGAGQGAQQTLERLERFLKDFLPPH
ncbi:MAG: SRPBCC domain-containing protein [Burkholderiaceae bacterium]